MTIEEFYREDKARRLKEGIHSKEFAFSRHISSAANAIVAIEDLLDDEFLFEQEDRERIEHSLGIVWNDILECVQKGCGIALIEEYPDR